MVNLSRKIFRFEITKEVSGNPNSDSGKNPPQKKKSLIYILGIYLSIISSIIAIYFLLSSIF